MNRLFLAGFIFAGVVATTACSESKAKSVETREPAAVRVSAAELASFDQEQRYAATTEPMAQVDLVFRTAGVVTDLYMTGGRPPEPGDRVAAGTVLARLRTTEYEARVATADAQLADATAGRAAAAAQLREAQAAATQAGQDLARGEALFAKEAMTRAELDAVRARREGAEARVAAARTNVDGFEARIRAAAAARKESTVPLGDTSIVAPFSGVLVARRIERASSVAAGTPAYTLADLRQVKVSFGVPDTALPQFTVGRVVRVGIDAMPGEQFSAHVIGVAPTADPATRLFHVQAVAENSGWKLKGGMVASIALHEKQEAQHIAIPLRSIRRLGDQFGVFVVANNRIESRQVTLGPSRDTLVAIESGLKAGELVVNDAGMRLNAGDLVKVVR